jgi:hypothetical protein
MLTPDSTPITSLQRGHWYKSGLNITPLGERACNVKCVFHIHTHRGHAVAQLVEPVCHKPKGRGFDFLWGHWDSLT